MTKFQVTDRVQDRDGFQGTIVRVTEWEGSVWYDVRFAGGEAVRYDSDLTLQPNSEKPKATAEQELEREEEQEMEAHTFTLDAPYVAANFELPAGQVLRAVGGWLDGTLTFTDGEQEIASDREGWPIDESGQRLKGKKHAFTPPVQYRRDLQ